MFFATTKPGVWVSTHQTDKALGAAAPEPVRRTYASLPRRYGRAETATVAAENGTAEKINRYPWLIPPCSAMTDPPKLFAAA